MAKKNDEVKQEVPAIEMPPTLGKRICFALFFTAKDCNPNGDPLFENKPRMDDKGRSLITPPCITRKIRNRLMWRGEPVLVQADNHPNRDNYDSINTRAKVPLDAMKSGLYKDRVMTVCSKYTDVRLLGTVVTIGDGVSVTAPLTLEWVHSYDRVMARQTQITRSTNGVSKDTNGLFTGVRASDTMGMKWTIDFGLYTVWGEITPETARYAYCTYDDTQLLKQILQELFEGDAATGRPAGSMECCKLVWWEQESNGIGLAKLKRTIDVKLKDGVTKPTSYADYEITFVDEHGVPEANQGNVSEAGFTREVIELY